MKTLIASTPTHLTYVPASKDLLEMDPRVLVCAYLVQLQFIGGLRAIDK